MSEQRMISEKGASAPPVLIAMLQFGRQKSFKRLWVCLVFAMLGLLLVVGFLRQHPPSHPPQRHFNGASRSSNNTQLDKFWATLESRLREAKPQCSPIKVNAFCSIDGNFRKQWPELLTFGACNPPDMTYHPGQHAKPRADHIRLNQKDIESLKRSHEYMVANSRDLAHSLPYRNGTSGIVMVGGGKYGFLILLSLHMLRRTGSNLPVEVFLVSEAEYDHHFCERHLPFLNAKCRLLSDTLSATPQADKISKYQYKSFAILFSSFENVFFLDADAFVAFKPDEIFTSEPFISTGLVTWPDLWAETSSPIYFQMAGLPVPPIQRYSTDSGSLVYSKTQHAASLLLATYYNYYGPDYYYPLLSQGAHGQGDKETYLHAAIALDMDHWDVKTPLWEIGQWLEHRKFLRVGMGQHYPEDDLTLSNADISRHHRKIRPFVLHINSPWKMLPKEIFKWSGPTWHNGKQIRILGTRQDMMESFGYDIEAAMWEQFKLVACRLGNGCDTAKEYYRNVFGENVAES